MTSEETKDTIRLMDQEQVRHIAFLIRLGLSEEEVEKFSDQLSTIVDYFNRLAEVDVDDVPPYRHRPITRDELREDVAQPTMEREDLLANAPQHQDGYIRVPVVLDVPDEG
ncbi:MAG: Asp-tRNA(Asn)/Glu-tRNA(Gln) amidotransferase subunit GatC [Anaerolineae bacterium]